MVPISGFRGINNREDRVKLNLEWFEQADNAIIDDQGGVLTRPGCTSSVSGIADIYGSQDGRRSFMVRDSDKALLKFDGNAGSLIYNHVGSGPYRWTDAADITLVIGNDLGVVIYPDRVEPWGVAVPNKPTLTEVPGNLPAGTYQVTATVTTSQGRDGGATAASRITLSGNASAINMEIYSVPIGHEINWWVTPPDGSQLFLATVTTEKQVTWSGPITSLTIPLKTQFFQPPPRPASAIAFWMGRVWVAIYDQVQGFTRLFPSQPLEHHYFVLDDSECLDVQGRVTYLAGTAAGLLIGTHRAIHVYVPDVGLQTLAEYGVVESQASFDDDRRCWFWTERGWCAFPPFENLSEDIVSFDAGSRASVLVREVSGTRQVISAPSTQGESAFNKNIPMITI